jgi:hypothetical protein
MRYTKGPEKSAPPLPEGPRALLGGRQLLDDATQALEVRPWPEDDPRVVGTRVRSCEASP